MEPEFISGMQFRPIGMSSGQYSYLYVLSIKTVALGSQHTH